MNTTATGPAAGACTHMTARERRLRTLEKRLIERIEHMHAWQDRDVLVARERRVFSAIIDEMRGQPCACVPRGRS